MLKQKFAMRVAVNLILIKGKQALLLRRFNTGWHDGEYSVVAGHVDGNETIAQAMVREAKEEAGIDINEGDVRVLHVQHRINPDWEYIDFSVTVDTWSGEASNCEPDKCDDLGWFPIDELPANTIPYIRNVFENISNDVPFSEWRETAA